jgi:hypothetical protein
MTTTQFLDNLVLIAKQDLSLAHITQHGNSAKLGAQLRNFKAQGPGAFSVVKSIDTVAFDNNTVTGKKYWVSNLPNVDWAVIQVKHNGYDRVVYVEIDDSVKFEMISTMGMEKTLTGHMIFDHTPCHVICDYIDTEYFVIRRLTYLGFIAIHYGLALSLFEDIDNFTRQHNIACEYNKEKLRLQLDVVDLLWNQLEKEITLKHQETFYWQQKNTMYAFAKKCLVEVCQFTTEITGSGLYDLTTEHNQRYRDALIYSTHMKNLYVSMKDRK